MNPWFMSIPHSSPTERRSVNGSMSAHSFALAHSRQGLAEWTAAAYKYEGTNRGSQHPPFVFYKHIASEFHYHSSVASKVRNDHSLLFAHTTAHVLLIAT